MHATLVDTTIAVRERLDGALPTALKDTYIVEMNRFAALFGIPGDLLPTSWAAHETYMERMLGPTLAVAPCAREMAAFLIGRAGLRSRVLGTHRGGDDRSSCCRRGSRASSGSRARGCRARRARGARDVRADLPPAAAHARRDPGALGGAAAHRGTPPSKLGAWTEGRLYALSSRVTGL